MSIWAELWPSFLSRSQTSMVYYGLERIARGLYPSRQWVIHLQKGYNLQHASLWLVLLELMIWPHMPLSPQFIVHFIKLRPCFRPKSSLIRLFRRLQLFLLPPKVILTAYYQFPRFLSPVYFKSTSTHRQPWCQVLFVLSGSWPA